MTILAPEDLEFAKTHISKFYDSDFFPKPFEFEAIWFNWDDVKAELTAKNVQKLFLSSPVTVSAPKPNQTFRVVHQLEPLDALVYTALVASVCEDIETARMDPETACSYRIAKLDGSFFGGGAGWDVFTERTETLATEYDFVLVLDISDFYNQISLHRVNNAIAFANPAKHLIATDIEKFLLALNAKNSQGIPVGPAASIVLAEATLVDVDQYVQNAGFSHTRYVDDFRVFSDSPERLEKLLESMTLYLYNSHRLSLSSEKSSLVSSSEFLERKIHNQTAEERAELFQTLEVFNPYSEDVEEVEFDPNDFTVIADMTEKLRDALEKLVASNKLDLGVARAIIRTAKRGGIDEIAETLLRSLCFFAPVVNDVFVYLHKITTQENARQIGRLLEEVLNTRCSKFDLVKYWVEWYVARHVHQLDSLRLRDFVYESGSLEHAAVAAVKERNVAWIRAQKGRAFQLTARARRAVMFASQVLPNDEREPWLQYIIQNSPDKLDLWMSKWVNWLAANNGQAIDV